MSFLRTVKNRNVSNFNLYILALIILFSVRTNNSLLLQKETIYSHLILSKRQKLFNGKRTRISANQRN